MTSSDRPLREILEAALVADPDDLGAHSAYADHLIEEGDPRGEFIQVQLALGDEKRPAAERKTLKEREAQLLDAHGRTWLGELAGYLLDGEDVSEYLGHYGLSGPGVYRFERGWIHQLWINGLSIRLAQLMVHCPELRLLSDLAIETISDGGRESEEALAEELRRWLPQHEHSIGLQPLLECAFLGNVRTLRVGRVPPDDFHESFQCHEHSSLVVELVAKMPRLEELLLYANGFNLTNLLNQPTLSHLRVLLLYHSPEVHPIQLLANNPTFENLTHLFIHPHHFAGLSQQERNNGFKEVQGYLPLSVVRPILYSPHLPKLAHLRLRVSSMGDAGCEDIVKSGNLKRLKTLDLRHGRITAKGAQILAACPDLKKLEWLDLDRNSISQAGIQAIKATGVKVRIDDQHPESDVLDSLGQEYWDQEAEYLREGEFE